MASRLHRVRSRNAGAERLEPRQLLSADGIYCRPASPGITSQLTNLGTSDLLSQMNVGDQLTGVHELGFDGYGQTVVVIDSGIAYDHPALGAGLGNESRVVGGWDFAESDADPYDDGPSGFHGTHVAGIIASNDVEHTGVAPNVDLVGLRVFDDQGTSKIDWLEDALDWVHEHRATFEFPITTVNLSVGVSEQNAAKAMAQIDDELRTLESDGIFVAVAAGNYFEASKPEHLTFPGSHPSVVPVASADSEGKLSWYTQRSDRVLVAPGENIVSTAPDYIAGFDGLTNDFYASSGTSMAAPFVAGASILVRQAMESVAISPIDQDAIYDHLYATGDTIIDSKTGDSFQRINLMRAIESLVSNPNDVAAKAATDLGVIDFTELDKHSLSQSNRFTVTASRTGYLSILTHNDANRPVSIQVRDQRNDSLRAFQTVSGRSDFMVQQGESYSVEVVSDTDLVDLSIANLVSRSGNEIVIEGTSGDDDFYLEMNVTANLFVNEIEYVVGSDIENIRFNGSNGTDELTVSDRISGSLASDASDFTYSNRDWKVFVKNIESTIVDGQGSTASLVGTAGRETLSINSANVGWRVGSNKIELTGFHSIDVAGSTGHDVLQFEDSAADDHLIVHPGFTQTISGQRTISATGFEQVEAHAVAGGHDKIEVFDSASSDQVYASPGYLQLRGFQHYVQAHGFESTITHAVNGGYDRARLKDSTSDDTFSSTSDSAELGNANYSNRVNHFEAVFAYASEGNDNAFLVDSPGNDEATMSPTASRIRGDNFNNFVSRFDTVTIEATRGGTDAVFMFDSSSDDHLFASPDFARLSGDSFYNLARGFAELQAFSRSGNDRATLFDSAQNDLFQSDSFTSSLQGDGFWNKVFGFGQVMVHSNRGYDRAILRDLETVDSVTRQDESVAIQRQDSTVSLSRFEQIDPAVDDAENLDPVSVETLFGSV